MGAGKILPNFTFANNHQRARKDFHHAQIVQAGGNVGCACQQEIARQHSRRPTPP